MMLEELLSANFGRALVDNKYPFLARAGSHTSPLLLFSGEMILGRRLGDRWP